MPWISGLLVSLFFGFVGGSGRVGFSEHGSGKFFAASHHFIHETVALGLVLITVFLGLRTLPPKPARYKRHRSIFMVLQWAYLPVTTIVYNSFAALYSQTRLMFGWYISKFDVTEKAVFTESGKKITSGKE